MTQTRPQIYQLLSAMLEYPSPDLAESARECAALLSLESPDAAVQIERFLALTEETPPGRLEEFYTGPFDINPTGTMNAGYQLFGGSYKRGNFLFRLKQRYRHGGFSKATSWPIIWRSCFDSWDGLSLMRPWPVN